MPKKKNKRKYDKNGHWVEERNRIKGAIRRVFRLSPQMKDVLNSARVELKPLNKKDGTPSKKKRVRFKCAICGNLFPAKKRKTSLIQVDHVDTVVPLYLSETEMDFEKWIATVGRGIFCDKSNLQVVCSVPMKHNNGEPSCHKKKTDLENYLRRKWKEVREKFDSYDKFMEYVNSNYDYNNEKWAEEYEEYLKNKQRKKKNGKSKKRSRSKSKET